MNTLSNIVIKSIGSNVPPLTETIKLWDLIISQGVHMNTFFASSLLYMEKDTMLE